MKASWKLLWVGLSLAAASALCVTSVFAASTVPHYLITNNDSSQGNTATFYTIFDNGVIKQAAVVSTGGTGNDGIGAVATKRVSVLSSSTQHCVYISDAGSNDVAGIAIANLTLAGTFRASSTDTGTAEGVGIVNNGAYLYANFTGSETLATYQISSGCALTFIGDTPAAGLNGAPIVDMWAHKNLLVASFADGSIESFDISGGKPVSNGDLQFSNGYLQHSSVPAGVDITADGHYAIFGGTLTPELVEVSDISSGKLAPTVVYSNVGSGAGSEAIWLSPDEALLYLSNFSSNSVTAARFDKSTGAVTSGCISGTLRGIGFEAGLATARPTGSGATLYVAEPDSSIGFVNVDETGSSCSLTESPRSPVQDTNTITVESIGVFPPRLF